MPFEINLKNRLPTGEGASGCYFKLTKQLGVKLVYDDYRLIKEEYKKLQKLNKLVPNVWPKCYGLVGVIWEEKKYEGLLMEHIPGKQLSAYEDLNENKYYKLMDKAKRILIKCDKIGIFWDDSYGHNMIATKGNKVRFIDAEDVAVSIENS